MRIASVLLMTAIVLGVSSDARAVGPSADLATKARVIKRNGDVATVKATIVNKGPNDAFSGTAICGNQCSAKEKSRFYLTIATYKSTWLDSSGKCTYIARSNSRECLPFSRLESGSEKSITVRLKTRKGATLSLGYGGVLYEIGGGTSDLKWKNNFVSLNLAP